MRSEKGTVLNLHRGILKPQGKVEGSDVETDSGACEPQLPTWQLLEQANPFQPRRCLLLRKLTKCMLRAPVFEQLVPSGQRYLKMLWKFGKWSLAGGGGSLGPGPISCQLRTYCDQQPQLVCDSLSFP